MLAHVCMLVCYMRPLLPFSPTPCRASQRLHALIDTHGLQDTHALMQGTSAVPYAVAGTVTLCSPTAVLRALDMMSNASCLVNACRHATVDSDGLYFTNHACRCLCRIAQSTARSLWRKQTTHLDCIRVLIQNVAKAGNGCAYLAVKRLKAGALQ
jgi:hypothetical protein